MQNSDDRQRLMELIENNPKVADLLKTASRMSVIKTKVKLEKIKIQSYASIGEEGVEISFPKDKPVILFGPNNAGKTNILSGIQTFFDFLGQGSKLPERQQEAAGEDSSEVLNAAKISNGLTADTKLTLWYEDSEHHEGRMVELEYDSGRRTFLNKHPHPEDPLFSGDTFIGTDYGNRLSELRNILKSDTPLTPLGGRLLKRIASALSKVRHFDGIDAYRSKKLLLPGKGELAYLGLIVDAFNASEAVKGNLATNRLLSFDEPETHLHFLAQEGFMEIINDLCKEEGIQVMIATHSENFLNADDLEGFVRVYRAGKGAEGNKIKEVTKVRQPTRGELFHTCHIRQHNEKLPIEVSTGAYWSLRLNPDQIKGFFADVVLLAEGQTEQYSLPIYLSRSFLSKNGIQIVPCYGKSALAGYWRLFNTYGYKCFVLYDHDTKDDKNANKKGRDLNTELKPYFYEGKESKGDKYSLSPTAAYFHKDWEDYFKSAIGEHYETIKEKLETNYEVRFEGEDKDPKALLDKAIALQAVEMGIDIPFIDELRTNLIELVSMNPKKYMEYVEKAEEEVKKIEEAEEKQKGSKTSNPKQNKNR